MGTYAKIKNLIFKKFFRPETCCLICRGETFDDSHFCEKCFEKLPFNDGNICPLCGRKHNVEGLCIECKSEPYPFKMARSSFIFSGDIRSLIYKLKRKHNRYIAGEIAPYLKESYFNFGFDCDVIVYVPIIAKREYKRKYNHARLLAKELSPLIGLPIVYDAIVKVKNNKKQKRLTRRERMENSRSSYKLLSRKGIEGKRVLLVDDVFTTGSTATAITNQLLKGKALSVSVLTLASVKLREV